MDARKTLLDLIPYFHAFYARHKMPDALEVARNIGIAVSKMKP